MPEQSKMIVQVADAVGPENCRRLMAMHDRHVHLTKVRDQTGHPVVYWSLFRNAADAAEIVPRLVEECLRNIGSQLQFAEPLYPETVILTAIGAGGRHNRHADNCRQNERGDWVANHAPQRDMSAIYYLNDEFEGGEIAFERAQFVVKPRRGLLLAFPSDADHVHEVLPVRSGVRYTMPVWFTKQQRFALADLPLSTSAIKVAVRAPG
jgi:predicted 2-oxoglutarate/Fe(II)-dependent dioxygenase YbiX